VKRVFGSFDLQLLHHKKNLLEAAGIEVLIRNQHLSSAMGELPPAECQTEIWVLDDADAAKAEEVLRWRPPSGPDWTCGCGESLGPQFTQCWRCGAHRKP
jgi:hypothetical protein